MLRIFDRINNVTEYKRLIEDTRGNNFTTAFGVQPTEKPFVAGAVPNFTLYLTTDYVEAQRIVRTLNAINGGGYFYLPYRDDVLLYKKNTSSAMQYNRNSVLNNILKGKALGVVACVESIMQPVPLVSKFEYDTFTIAQGNEYDTTKLARMLISAGYKRVDGITCEGEFVMHGDILEVQLPFGERYRVDFWGDNVESIFTVGEDLSSKDKIDSVDIFPLYCTSGLDHDGMDKLTSFAKKGKISADAHSRLDEIISNIAVANADVMDDAWLYPFTPISTVADYLPKDSVVILDEPKLISSRVDLLYKEHNTRIANLVTAGEVLPLHINALLPQDGLFDKYKTFHQLALQTLPYTSLLIQPQSVFNFKTSAVSNYSMGETMLAKDISDWKHSGYEVMILAGADGVTPVKTKLAEQACCYVTDDETMSVGGADGLILPIAVERGFISHTNKLAVIGTRDLGRGMNSARVGKTTKQTFLAVEKGDYVVHDFHGIGLCEGIQKIPTPSGEMKDYIVVMYKNGDHLYVPAENSGTLTRYSGGENPTLSKLGGADFAKVKDKVRQGIREMSINLLQLYAEREKARGFSYEIDSYLTEEFNNSFPYKLTPDQEKCENEIDADLVSKRIMDRVVVGDVGFGKTEVAMRCAFKVLCNGYQVAVLVPTTILAEQHYNTFVERMAKFNINVKCLNRFRTPSEQKEIIKGLADGTVDVVIGTHRLLSKDVKFNKLGLLILDEEQRFGVEHKEKIKAVKTSVDVLTLSATPIPRTLHMALSGIRDISTITTPPVERMAVETFVAEENDVMTKDIIERELGRGGQVFVVYNSVQTIDSFAKRIAELVPSANIVVAHGQMDESILEDAVLQFANGKFNVLICSTIIENGIDMPNANTLIVYDADLLGLSQLYQLRGRVGRSNKLAYAYFMYRKDKILNEVAYKRLSSITEYSELGSGFKIAMKDLEIRGAGNILGREQHGHMVKVGYDMYARLLREAVAEVKGSKVEHKVNVDLEVDIEAFAPESYITSSAERMDFYQQLASAESITEVDNIRKRITDVYGVIPRETANLFEVAELRVLASKVGVIKIIAKPCHGEVIFGSKESMFTKAVFDYLSTVGDRLSVANNGYAVVFQSADYLQKNRLISAIKDFLVAINI